MTEDNGIDWSNPQGMNEDELNGTIDLIGGFYLGQDVPRKDVGPTYARLTCVAIRCWMQLQLHRLKPKRGDIDQLEMSLCRLDDLYDWLNHEKEAHYAGHKQSAICELADQVRRSLMRALDDSNDANDRETMLKAAEKLADQLQMIAEWGPDQVPQKVAIVVQDAPKADPDPKTRASKDKAKLRSWTQIELDNAIREYKAKRASTYTDLCKAVRKNKPGAKKKATDMFGRNAIARAFGVRSRSMVSKSPPWNAIAEELGFSLNRNRRAQGTRHTKPTGKVGHEIAVEEKSSKPEDGADNAPAELAWEATDRQETIRQINKLASAGKTPEEKGRNQAAADDLIQKLQRGEYTDEQAREVVTMVLSPDGQGDR